MRMNWRGVQLANFDLRFVSQVAKKRRANSSAGRFPCPKMRLCPKIHPETSRINFYLKEVASRGLWTPRLRPPRCRGVSPSIDYSTSFSSWEHIPLGQIFIATSAPEPVTSYFNSANSAFANIISKAPNQHPSGSKQYSEILPTLWSEWEKMMVSTAGPRLWS